jgi:hypothetical protein
MISSDPSSIKVSSLNNELYAHNNYLGMGNMVQRDKKQQSFLSGIDSSIVSKDWIRLWGRRAVR